jgi:nucleolar protein 53
MADAAIFPPQQHKQPSRKGKKAWRKNVDITEVQDGLEEVREEVIKHGYSILYDTYMWFDTNVLC